MGRLIFFDWIFSFQIYCLNLNLSMLVFHQLIAPKKHCLWAYSNALSAPNDWMRLSEREQPDLRKLLPADWACHKPRFTAGSRNWRNSVCLSNIAGAGRPTCTRRTSLPSNGDKIGVYTLIFWEGTKNPKIQTKRKAMKADFPGLGGKDKADIVLVLVGSPGIPKAGNS